jgi:hypothetical protein
MANLGALEQQMVALASCWWWLRARRAQNAHFMHTRDHAPRIGPFRPLLPSVQVTTSTYGRVAASALTT